jgi:UDP-N-acetylglucosamine:LPS N-acetylglucosamine transferase
MKKVLFISSTGGHLSELLQLRKLFDKYDYHIITEKTKSNLKLKNDYPNRVNYLIYGSKTHFFAYPFKLIANCFISLFLYFKIRPKVIVTTGAHTSGPMCCIGKIFGSKIIYIETFANIHTKTITGRLVYRFADEFIVQWESMLKLYPKATYGGWIY